MTATINTVFFSELSVEALRFYKKNGWVVLTSQADSSTCDEIYKNWGLMVEEYSCEVGVTKKEYLDVVSQWRNLWQYHLDFMKVLESPLSKLASSSFELKGARLLHDHFICKTGNSGNGTVPWHQDSMYWPVDRTGMSTWLALQDTPVEHGCLEVVSGSHDWGSSAPIDFMTAQTPISSSTKTVLLPVNKGGIVLLHSRTWHRSAPTKMQNAIRLAHISLWVPEQTRYWPENADWHPLNKQVSVQKGELLNEEEFPIFGERTLSIGNSIENKHSGVETPHGMFNARDRIEKQIQKMLNCQHPLSVILNDEKNRIKISTMIYEGSKVNLLEVKKVVEHVWISATTYERHKGRNVFNSAYKAWEIIFTQFTNENNR